MTCCVIISFILVPPHGLFLSGRLALLGQAVNTYCHCQNQTLDYHLCVFTDVHKDHAVRQAADDQYAGDDAGHSSDTAVDGYAAQDNAGDDVEFKSFTDCTLRGVGSGEQNDACKSCKESGQCIDQVFHAVDTDTGQFRRFFISADCIEIAAEERFVQNKASDREAGDHNDAADRNDSY